MSIAGLRARLAGGLGPFLGDQDDPSNGAQAALEAWFLALQGNGQGAGLTGGSPVGASDGPAWQGQIETSLFGSGDAAPLGGHQQALGDSPACSMPPPASGQPVVETEGFLPFEIASEPQGPACSMPLPLDRQRSSNTPLLIAGGYDRNFLAILGNGSTSEAAQVGRLAGGLSPADFSAWFDVLSPVSMAGGLGAAYSVPQPDAPSLVNPGFEIGERA